MLCVHGWQEAAEGRVAQAQAELRGARAKLGAAQAEAQQRAAGAELAGHAATLRLSEARQRHAECARFACCAALPRSLKHHVDLLNVCALHRTC